MLGILMYSFCELNECCTFNDERIVMLLVHENEIKKLRDRVRVARARANFSSQRVILLRVRVARARKKILRDHPSG